MLWNIYLRGGFIYVPTMAETTAGFFLDAEPVDVAPANDFDSMQKAIGRAIMRGNPQVPTPTRAEFPKPVVLKYAKVKSWSAFERKCESWTILENEGRYQIKRGRRADRGWEDDPEQIESLPRGIGIGEVAHAAAGLIQTTITRRTAENEDTIDK